MEEDRPTVMKCCTNAKYQGRLVGAVENGHVVYRLAPAGTAPAKAAAPSSKKTRAAQASPQAIDSTPSRSKDDHEESERVHARIGVIDHAVNGKRDSSLADLVGYTEAALQAYIESCVNPSIYGFLLNARDAARREFERAHA
jgi:hypothetical protein